MKYITKGQYTYGIKERYIVKNRSQHITCWGKYCLWLFENDFYITKRSYRCKNSEKEYVILFVPKFLISELINKKHLDIQYINKMRSIINFYKENEDRQRAVDKEKEKCHSQKE